MLTEKILADTNLLIYSIDKDSEFHKRTQDLFEKYKDKLFTTSKNISEFLAVTTNKNFYSLNTDESIEAVREFESHFTILYPDINSFFLFQNLLLKYKPTGLLVHDYEIASIGIVNNVKTIATLNVKDFSKIKEIEIISI